MPRQRQRVVFCDCYDCVDRPAQASLSEDGLKAAVAVARQEPPPKGLLVVASGFLRYEDKQVNLDACTLPHLNHLVNEGNLGFLSSRQGCTGTPGIHDLSQLLEVNKELSEQGSLDSFCTSAQTTSIAERYKGMEGLFASTSAAACKLARACGFSVSTEAQACLQPQATAGAGEEGAHTQRKLPASDALANIINQQLSPEQGSTGPDLFVLHLDSADLLPPSGSPTQQQGQGGEDDDQAWNASLEALEWMDSFVKHLMAHTGLRERTFLGLVLTSHGRSLGPPPPSTTTTTTSATAPAPPSTSSAAGASWLQGGGAAIDAGARVMTPGMLPFAPEASSSSSSAGGAGAPPRVQRPLQSFQFRGLEAVSVVEDAPMLVVRRLPGVVRRDRAGRLSLAEAAARGGMGCVLADRLLPEMSYKLARAPKYGA